MPQNFQVFAWDRRSRLNGFPDFAGSIIRIPEFSTIRPYGRAMVKEGKCDKTVGFSKSDGTAISFKAKDAPQWIVATIKVVADKATGVKAVVASKMMRELVPQVWANAMSMSSLAYDLKLQLCDVLCHLRPKQFHADTGEIVSTVASTHGMFDNADPNRGGLPQPGKTSKVAHLDIVNPQTNALVGVSDDASAAAAALGYTILGGAINLMGIREGSFAGTTEATADANLGAEDMLTNKALRMMLKNDPGTMGGSYDSTGGGAASY